MATAAQQSAFLSTYGPQAVTAGTAIGVDPNIVYSQWAMESGYGTNAQSAGYNVGGIMPGGQAAVYASPADFTQNYINVIKQNDPNAVGTGSNTQAFVTGLQQGHYFGTDSPSNYYNNVSAIAATNPLAGVTAASATGTPDPLSGEPMGPGGATSGSGVVAGSGAIGNTLFGSIWEIVQRAGMMGLGALLILLALGALLMQSKTVKVSMSKIGAVAA